MSAAIVNIVKEPTLDDLAEAANREHGAVEAAAAAAVTHAIQAGEALLAAREIVGYGGWHDWLKAKFSGSVPLASAYMRIAHYQETIRDCDTFAQARAVLRGLPAVTSAAPPGHADSKRQSAISLIDDGATITEAADVLGVAFQTVKRWTDPGYAREARAKAREQERQRYQEKREEESRKRQARLTRMARQAGGAISEAYSMAERLQDVLATAETQAADAEARDALAKAGAHYRRMRDEIVRALGAS